MTKYVSQTKQLSELMKKVLINIGDGELRDLRKFIAQFQLEGFREKKIWEMLDVYCDLGGVQYKKNQNQLFSVLNLKNTIIAKKEAESIFKGEPVKEEPIKQEKGLCKCGHEFKEHIEREPFLGGCSYKISNEQYCPCKGYDEVK